MGFNIAGIVTNIKLENKENLEDIFETSLEYTKDVDGEIATKTKYNSEFDVHTNSKGSFILFQLGEIYDISNKQGEFMQFMISDVSGTYYFEKYKNGILERKLIVSEGEIVEEEGNGIIDENDDFMDKVLEISDDLLGINEIFDINYKRFVKNEK